jgi:hypothetical protein
MREILTRATLQGVTVLSVMLQLAAIRTTLAPCMRYVCLVITVFVIIIHGLLFPHTHAIPTTTCIASMRQRYVSLVLVVHILIQTLFPHTATQCHCRRAVSATLPMHILLEMRLTGHGRLPPARDCRLIVDIHACTLALMYTHEALWRGVQVTIVLFRIRTGVSVRRTPEALHDWRVLTTCMLRVSEAMCCNLLRNGTTKALRNWRALTPCVLRLVYTSVVWRMLLREPVLIVVCVTLTVTVAVTVTVTVSFVLVFVLVFCFRGLSRDRQACCLSVLCVC